MTRVIPCLIAITLAAGAAGSVAAQSPELNVKLGLWEMTMNFDMPGAPPGMDTSKMTPEQIAQVQAMMRGRAMAPSTVKTCMTKEKLADHKYTSDRAGQTCKQTVTKSTATALDVTQVCTGTQATTSDMHIEALSPTSIKIVNKMTSGRGGPMTATINGKWIGADCGDVK
jgi:hypothetical protein